MESITQAGSINDSVAADPVHADSYCNVVPMGSPIQTSPLLRRIWRQYHALIRGLISAACLLVLWEVTGRYILTSQLMFAPLSAVIQSGIKLWLSGELPRDILVSFTALAAGFGIAIGVGVVLGSLIGVSKAIGEHLDPLIDALYATPLVALSPILIMSLGIGTASKIAIVFMMAVFPILINTTVGIRSTDSSLIEAARSFAASRLDVFRWVLLPSALPFIVAGLRLGVGRGLVGIFIGELFGAREGLGYLISISAQTFDVPGMFVGVSVLAISGVLFVSAFEAVERYVAPWRRFELKA